MVLRRVRHFGGVSVLALSALLPGMAWAEASAPATVEELVVTATRREESLQKVPSSITAITGAVLREQGIGDYEGLVRTVPGVIATGLSNFNKMTIRGVETSQTTSSVGAQRSVSIYLDELPLTTFSVVTPDITPYDVARVEVLRGPQGTLFGSGSLAGTVRYITNRPDPRRFAALGDAELGASAGSSLRRRLNGVLNIPLVQDQAALRVVATYKNDDGYIDNVGVGRENANTQNDWGLRAGLRWEPTDRFAATLTGSYNRNVLGDTALYDPKLGFRKSSEDAPFRVKVALKTFNVALNYDLGWAALTSSTSVSDAPDDWNLELFAIIPGVPFHLREVVDTKTLVEEIRLVSRSEGPFDWVAGAYYLRQKTDQQDVLYFSTPFIDGLRITGLPTNVAPGSAESNDIETKNNQELAAFGEVGYRVTPTLKLTAGARVADSIFTARITGEGYTAPNVFLAIFTGGRQNVPIVAQTPGRFSTGHVVKVTPKVSLTWEPSSTQTLYLTAAQGYRRGQPNGVVAQNGGRSLINANDPAIIPASASGDALWNYEVGAKSLWFDSRLRTNLAAYLIEWKDMQVPLVRTSDQAPYVGNIGKARSIGLEGELQARPLEHLDMGVNFTLQRAKVVSITGAQALISGALPNARLASPDFKVSGYVKYDWELADGARMYARVDAQHVGGYPNAFPNTPGAGTLSPTFAQTPAYEKVDVSLGWARNNLSAVLYVENLLDDDTPIYINPANFSFNRYGTLRPRTAGLRLGWRY